MCYWLLPESGIPIARTSIQLVTPAEMQTTEINQMIQANDQKINVQLQQLSTSNDFEILSLYPEDESPL